MDNQRKQHIIVVQWCCMCKKNGESVDHLLLHCEITSALWNTIFSSVGLVWVMSRRVVNIFACWRVPGASFQLDTILKMIPPYLMWCLWRERNGCSFEDHARTLVELKDPLRLFLWVATLDCSFLNSHAILDFISAIC
jgi:hypothetical protein